MCNTDEVGLRNLQYWNAYISKEFSKINYLNFSLRKLERKKQITSKVSRRNEIKIREQISETENWKTDREKSAKPKAHSLTGSMISIKSLGRLRRKKKLLTSEMKGWISFQIPHTLKE